MRARMTGGRWIALAAALALGFGLWLMHWHRTEIAPLRAARAKAMACEQVADRAKRSMARMVGSVAEVNRQARELSGRHVEIINGIMLEVR